MMTKSEKRNLINVIIIPGMVIYVLLKWLGFWDKNYKPYMCDFKSGVYQNPDVGSSGDPCKKGASRYKFYYSKKFKDYDKCVQYIYRKTNTPEMKKKYPVNAYMVGCDQKW